MSEWLSPTPRDDIFARVVARGKKLRLIRRVVAGATVAGVVAAGAAGYAAGAADSLDVLGEGTVDLPDATAAYHACPGTEVLGEVHRGDRVLLTGVNEGGDWYEVRSPFDLLDRVWLPASAVTPDAAVDLPEVSCGLTQDELILATGEVVTTTTSTTSTTSTTLPGETTTTFPDTTPTTGTPTTKPSVTTVPTTAPPTTQAPDITGPTITLVDVSAPNVMVAGTEFCGLPETSTIKVNVTDPGGVSEVRLRFNPDGTAPFGQKLMARNGNQYAAATNVYRYDQGYTYPAHGRMHIAIWAVDSSGNVTTVALNANSDVYLHTASCPPPESD